MCLAMPALIVSTEGNEAEVDLAGVRRRIGLQLVPEARVGDYVLVHAGFAINVLDADEAAATLRIFDELAASEADGEAESHDDAG